VGNIAANAHQKLGVHGAAAGVTASGRAMMVRARRQATMWPTN
jgi:hypothetical protein